MCSIVYLREPRLLFTNAINADSKLLTPRDVRNRVKAIAPFIDFRGDPYLISVPKAQQGSIDPSNQTSNQRQQHQYWVVEVTPAQLCLQRSSLIRRF